ncbi:pilus assembly protein CpaD [Sphingobium sp. OAS761]|uniref:CpaD family pilus assembly protein n=1 Tax=Sphingobium sp. OAS761 TaxID=2817901 RepID=UPI00209FB1BD|nr:CpaD family pilus assembly protein [Sphingobium sp. OAS761]MCP1470598.1 pilus assembly protein CpaD [Sphingobium sp. OAS761]
MTSSIPTRLSIRTLGALAVLALPLTACVTDSPNRSMESVHQPVVSYASYTYDVQAGPGDTLTAPEARRLDDWFTSIDLGYGDQVAIVSDGYYGPALRDGIANVAARRGLLVGEDSSAAAGVAPQGSVRLIVRRATASVPGCPDWRSKVETDPSLGTSSNYGCATNGNLAAMIANPEDLVRGQVSDSELRVATSNRAISTYREKTPSGSGELKQVTAGGQ